MRETREISSEKGGHVTHVSLSKDMSLDAYPPKSKYVRVDDFYQAVAVRKHELGTEGIIELSIYLIIYSFNSVYALL